jgi:CHAT domain-containing protein/tetratricopeptide (TPR) repeat protein
MSRRFLVQLLVSSLILGSVSSGLNSSIAYAKPTVSLASQADALFSQGAKATEKYNYKTAIIKWEQALVLYKKLGDTENQQILYNNLGVVTSNMGDFPKAIAYYNKALRLAQEINTPKMAGKAYLGLSGIYTSQSNHNQAISFATKALQIALKTEDKQLEENAYDGLGSSFQFLGNYTEALAYYEHALKIAQEDLKDDQVIAGLYINMGIVYDYLGDYPKAIRTYTQSIQLASGPWKDITTSPAYNNLGVVYFALKDYTKAIELQTKSYELAKKTGDKVMEGRVCGSLGDSYDAIGDHQKAILFNNRGIEISSALGDKDAEGHIYFRLARNYEHLKQYDKALTLYQKSIAMLDSLGSAQATYEPQEGIARVLLAKNQPVLAVLFYKQAVNTLQTTRQKIKGLGAAFKKSFAESKSEIYRQLADLLLKQGRVGEAQKVLELLKDQELTEYLRSTLTAPPGDLKLNSDEQKLWNDYQKIQGQELALYAQQSDLAAKIKGIPISQRNSNNPEYQQLREQSDKLYAKIDTLTKAFQEVFLPRTTALYKQANLTATDTDLSANIDRMSKTLADTRAAVIYPLILPDRLELVLLTPNAKPLHRTVKAKKEELDRLALALSVKLQSPSTDTKADLQQMYQWFFAPVEPEIEALMKAKTIDTVVYAPDGVLRLIPVGALYDGKQYLVERYPLGTITNLSQVKPAKSRPSSQLLAMGLTKTRSGLNALPGVKSEVQGLGSLFSSEAYLDENFTTANLRDALQEHPTFVHLATHANFSGRKEDTFILLWDKKLTLDDLKDLDLRSLDLLTLSACQTASGDEKAGLGLAGVAERSGANSVLGSLWSVSDSSTAQLMDHLYANLKAGMPKAEALRQAQIAMIHGSSTGQSEGQRGGLGVVPTRNAEPLKTTGNYGDPFYWAPFILIGNWQ